MSFLKELFNSIARTLGRIIAYALIGFLIFFVFGKLTNAQSIYFIRPTQIRLQTGSGIGNGTILSCVDSRVCGTLNNTSTYGPYFTYAWRISGNSTDDTITQLSKGEYYKISFTGTIQAIGSNVATAYNLYALVNNNYVNATCDVTPKFTTEKYSDSSNRYSFSYTCDKFYVDNTITWLALTIQGGNQKNYTYVNNLYLQDITEESAIIDNDNINTDKIIENNNQNTQDIINNQNQNQNQTNNKLDDINDSLTDSSVPSTDNVPTFEFNNGPISGLLTMPITWFNAFVSPGTCNDISLGSLLGTELKFACINPEDYLGSSIWNTIDIFIVVMMIISISSMILHIVDSFRNLNDMYDEYYTPKHQGYKTKHNGERI